MAFEGLFRKFSRYLDAILPSLALEQMIIGRLIIMPALVVPRVAKPAARATVRAFSFKVDQAQADRAG
jgi:hypothetical protein